MGASLGQLVIELAANTARLQSDLGKAVGMAESAAAKFKKAFSFVTAGAGGGLLSAALIGAAKEAIEFGDNINKAAIKAGIGGKAMSELAYAAKLADVDVASLSVAIKKMQVSLSEAGSGSKTAQSSLAALGLTVDQLQKRKPEQQFELIADRISKLADPADKARAATELFGKAGVDLLPMFEQGAAGIAKATAEARKLGLSFSDDQLNSLSDADDATKRLSASWEGFGTVLTAKVAPVLSQIMDSLAGLDTRSTAAKIKALEDTITAGKNGWVLPGGVPDTSKLEEQLRNLHGLQDLETMRSLQTGTFGGPTSRGDDGYAIGYAKRDAAEKAAADAKRAQAEYEKMSAEIVGFSEKVSQETNDILAKQREEDSANFVEEETKRLDFIQENADKQKEIEADVAKWRESQISASAEFFKDTFLQAFDDWINTGKFNFGKLLQYMAAEWARSGIAKLFSSSGSSSGGGGWLSAVVGGIGSLFGGGMSSGASTASWVDDFRAGGGPVSAGKTYLVGERGVELFRPSTNGTITANNALGGGVIHNNMTFNILGGDPAQTRRAISEALRQNNDDLERRGLLAKAAA